LAELNGAMLAADPTLIKIIYSTNRKFRAIIFPEDG
jgi:hypothetical protein